MKQEIKYEQGVLPFDTDTEFAVLSSLMMYNEKISVYDDLLSTELFYYEKEKAIFRCIDGVVNEGGITDVNSLYAYAQGHNVGYPLEKIDFVNIVSCASKRTLEQDIMRLRDMGRRRRLWRILQEYSQKVLDMTLNLDDVISDLMVTVSDSLDESGNNGIVSNDETLKGVRRVMLDNKKDDGRGNCLMTGFKLFDDYFLLRPETLTVIAAFTSVGKSTLALNIVQDVAKKGVPCAYYSLEMSSKELASRLLSNDANLTSSMILNKPLDDVQMQRLESAIAKNMGLPIYYDDRSTVDFNRTIRSVRKMVKTKGVRLVVIDYLQIYAQQTEDMEQSISYMARTAKNVAKELGIAVILISQLNRSALHPSIKMLRGSGQIEESADNVVLIDRPDAYPDNKVTKYEGEFRDANVKGTAKLILSKGRGVGTGAELVAFDRFHTRFKKMETVEAGHYEEQDDALPF